jgi:hypothetical protein
MSTWTTKTYTTEHIESVCQLEPQKQILPNILNLYVNLNHKKQNRFNMFGGICFCGSSWHTDSICSVVSVFCGSSWHTDSICSVVSVFVVQVDIQIQYVRWYLQKQIPSNILNLYVNLNHKNRYYRIYWNLYVNLNHKNRYHRTYWIYMSTWTTMVSVFVVQVDIQIQYVRWYLFLWFKLTYIFNMTKTDTTEHIESVCQLEPQKQILPNILKSICLSVFVVQVDI